MSQLENAELEEIFLEYEILTAQVDKIFADVRTKFSKEVTCFESCSDCCHALFDLSLVEAMAINRAFQDKFGYGGTRSYVIEQAGEADRELTRLKFRFYKEVQGGTADENVMEAVAKEKVRCPLLGTDNLCLLYESRPLTCRIYGVPTAINGKGHVCGKCNFDQGEQYPTLHLDKIQDRLAQMSRKIAKVLGSRYTELHHVYVPVSMALMNKYDDAYLGLKVEKKAKKKLRSPLEQADTSGTKED